MPLFDTFFDEVGFPALTEIFFGSAASYQSITGGDAIPCQIMLTRDVVLQPTGYDASTVLTGDVIEVLVSIVGDIAEGDTFTIDSTVYTCKKELENSGKVTKWVVHGA